MPHTFSVPLPVKHNHNLKYEITEHWFVFAYSKCDFWTSHVKKLTYTKFQHDRSFTLEVLKENVNSKWQILILVTYFAQFSNSDISGTTRGLELKFSEFSYFSDIYKWCKNEEILRGKGVKFQKNWMI